MNKKFFTLIMLVVVIFTFSAPQAMALTESQISAILGLLSAFDADQGVINNVNDALRGKTTTSNDGYTPGDDSGVPCTKLSHNLYFGISDATTDREVSQLQWFLTKTGDYTYATRTGYFGPATERAVQSYQRSQNLVSSGSPETTGYGVVGPKTRKHIQIMSCGMGDDTPDINSVKIKSFIYDGEGGSYKLFWDVSGPSNTICDIWNQNLKTTAVGRDVGLSGSTQWLTPTETTSYLLLCSTPKLYKPYGSDRSTVTIDVTSSDSLGTYKWTLGGGHGYTENISKVDALTNCKLNHNNNPNTSIYCSWNGDEIFSYSPIISGVTIGLNNVNQYSTTDSPTISGTATNTSRVTVSVGTDTVKYYTTSVSVVNGKWSYVSKPLSDGTYKVIASTGTGVVATGTLTVARIIISKKPTCTLVTDKEAYRLGDTIKFSWASNTHTNYASWQQPSPYKDNLTYPGDKLSGSGTQLINASVVGNPVATLNVYGDNGVFGSCSRTVSINNVASAPACVVEIDNQSFIPGEPVGVSWDSKGANYVITPSGEKGAEGGKLIYYPTKTTTYTLTAVGDGGTATCSGTATAKGVSATLTYPNQYSTSATPVISGTVTGAGVVGVVLSNSGGKVYGSGDVYSVNGKWSVLVSPSLANGTYTVIVYINNQAVAKGALTVYKQIFIPSGGFNY